MRRALQRLRSDGYWVADCAIRAAGCVVLAIGTAVALRLHHAVARPPVHPATAGEFAAAFLVVVCWPCGWAALCKGRGLFRLVAVPDRHVRFEINSVRDER